MSTPLLSIINGVLGGRAADRSADAQEKGLNRAIDLQERIYNESRADLEPFRKLNVQQANAFGELFGFSPVGPQAAPGGAGGGNAFADLGANEFGAFVLQDPQLYRDFNSLSGSAEKRIGRAGFDLNRDGNLSLEEYGAYIADQRGGLPQAGTQTAARTPSTAGTGRDLTMPTAAPVGQGTTLGPANDGGRSRYENSIFYDLGQIGLNEGGGTGDPYARFMDSAFARVARSGADRDIDRIDSALGAQGALFSSSRQAYADDAFADRMGGAFADFINNDRFAAGQQQNAFTNYLATLMGSPPSGAVNNTAALGQNFAANQGSAFAALGDVNANRALNMFGVQSEGLGNLARSASRALGMFG